MAPLQKFNGEPLQGLFMQVLASLKESPQQLTISRWDGEAPIEFLVNDHRFLSAAFAAVYHPDEWEKITRAIAAVLKQDNENLLALVKPYINNSLTSDFNSLTFMAVDCADNPIGSQAQYDESVARYPQLADYTRDQWRFQICHALHQQTSAAASHLTLSRPQVPALMLAGEQDPITHAGWALELKARWPELQLLQRPGVGHGVLGDDACVLQHSREYLDAPQNEFRPDCH